MILALLAAAGLGYWMWRRGELAWLNANTALAGIAALAALWVLASYWIAQYLIGRSVWQSGA